MILFINILLITSGIIYFLFVNYYLRGLQNLALTNKLELDDSVLPEISILLTARNEEKDIEETIISLSKQNYPIEKYKIIAVDDRSTDKTGDILNNLLDRVKNLDIIYLTEDDFYDFRNGKKVKKKNLSKKDALRIGIASLTTEFVITTDADCEYDKNWLRSYCTIIATNKDQSSEKLGFVGGMTIFHKENYKNLFEKIWQEMQNIDYFSHSLLGAGAIGHGKGLTANGNNMMLRRSLYDDSDSTDITNRKYASGDDFFLIQAAEERKLELQFLTNEESIVRTKPVDTLKELFNQRARWASKAGGSNKFGLFFSINTFIFYIGILSYLVLLSIFDSQFSISIFLILLLLKILPDTLFLSYGFGKFNIRFKPLYYILLQFFHIPFNIAVAIKGIVFGFTWKGQKFN